MGMVVEVMVLFLAVWNFLAFTAIRDLSRRLRALEGDQRRNAVQAQEIPWT